MQLILRDLQFDIVEARISGIILDPYFSDTCNKGLQSGLNWVIEVKAGEREINGNFWNPSFSYFNLPFSVRHWFELEGNVAHWDDPLDPISGEDNSNVFFWLHESITQGTVRILERNGHDFKIHWEGLCNVYSSDPYDADVPFSMEAVATFDGVTVQGRSTDTEDIMRERLALYLDPSDFIQHPIDMSNPIPTAVVFETRCFFEPI